MLLGSLFDAYLNGAYNFASSVAACLHRVGVSMPHDTGTMPVLGEAVVVDRFRCTLRTLALLVHVALDRHRLLAWSSTLMLSGFSPTVRLSITVNLPVSDGMMRRFLQSRLDCHKLPIVAGRQG